MWRIQNKNVWLLHSFSNVEVGLDANRIKPRLFLVSGQLCTVTKNSSAVASGCVLENLLK